ncbi:hypothetical protein K0T92_23720 [Paenibacillus oenotherae]|uniref:CBS domain-containing protein n=1 Tax=Paenibacillus oenotherae TaxID=1435645 RepID=A0ABS7DCR3_9BACL|nr:DUF294 nucleotidyltransferase-like domain-containing protein [Paenibacillus oenotherae]MBW7477724.1 hypothetical protein [Paenibacillus oenotherae]
MSDPVGAQLLSRIGTADEVVTLRSLRDRIHEHMEGLLSEQPVEQFYTNLNEAHDALIKRAIALAEANLARMGNSPPVPYAYLLFGSGGREEQTLSSDQDSGIVYADPDDESGREAAAQYFSHLAQAIVEMLQQLGYPPCDGNVISTNPEWCLSLTDWKNKLNEWFEEPDWERVRYLLIVADSRSIYGEGGLLQKLKDHFYSDMLDNPVIVRHMLNNTMRHKMLIGVFGQLLRERYGEDAGSLDVKYGAYIPMVNAIRMMSIQSGLRETSTLARIHSLQLKGKLSAEEASSYAKAFRLFMRLRLLATERNVDGMYTNNGKLSRRKLTKVLIEELKHGLRTGKKLQRRVFKQTKVRV